MLPMSGSFIPSDLWCAHHDFSANFIGRSKNVHWILELFNNIFCPPKEWYMLKVHFEFIFILLFQEYV